MALIDCNEAVFDRQANQILEMLEQGMSKADIATALGYNNPMSIDNYMRRRNFSWDSREKNFVPAAERYGGRARDNILQLHGSSKVDVIISKFDQGELNAIEIAKQVGFETHIELAKYMKSKGYQWDPVSGNYIKSNEPIITVQPDVNSPIPSSQNATLTEVLQNLVPILQNLNSPNRDNITKSKNDNIESEIPRYCVRGQCTTKGMRMAIVLDELMRQFSDEKNVSQRDIIEVAMIEFFMKYGYREKVEYFLSD